MNKDKKVAIILEQTKDHILAASGTESDPAQEITLYKPTSSEDELAVRFDRRVDGMYDIVKPLVTSSSALQADRNGPAQVATDSYRNGWDQIFGSKKTKQVLN